MALVVLQPEKKDRPFVHSADLATGVSVSGEGVLVGLDTSGDLVLADSSSGEQVRARGFTLTGSTVGDSLGGTRTKTKMSYIERGKIGGFSGLTIGADVYLTTNGGVTQSAPSASQTIVQIVGYASSATEIIFDIRPQGTTTNT